MRSSFLSSAWPFLLPGALLVGLSAATVTVDGGTVLCHGPVALGLPMPSEAAIPPEVEAPGMKRDAVWRFRYAPIGTEARAGIPYWIFRAMPRMFPEDFGEARGVAAYAKFGFVFDDDDAYYTSRPLPRGLVLNDTALSIPLFPVTVSLKRVAFNCASCHRGAYRDPDGKRTHAVDGMPSHSIDLQAFKRFFYGRFHDDRFTAEAVIAAVDAELALDGKAPLTADEQLAYRALVAVIRGGPLADWMDARPDNGRGRLDAFSAVKIEVLDVPDDGTVATVDFPALWNQAAEREGSPLRPWHHWDGNTADARARNFGSTVGVGGLAISVDKPGVLAVGAWTEQTLRSPPWPEAFGKPDPVRVERGRALFTDKCAGCHGLYDRARGTVTRAASGDRYMTLVAVGTDDGRQSAFPPAAAQALSDFGARRGLWAFNAFRGNTPARGGQYLCAPLDGIWARAPYLHNGSVPTLDKLLGPIDQRPAEFYTGSLTYNPAEVGFEYVAEKTPEGKAGLFRFRVAGPGGPLPGNGNLGHPFVVPDAEPRRDLVEYLKTL